MSQECVIPKDATILFGSGGSQTLIVVTKNKRVYKYFPVIYSSVDSKTFINKIIKNIEYEIDKLKKISNKIKCPHVVHLIKVIKCNKITKSIFNHCNDFVSFLTSSETTRKECLYLYNSFPTILHPNMYICELEYCPFTLKQILINFVKKRSKILFNILIRVLFQLCFTLLHIRKVFPYFIHGDLHIENVLCSIDSGTGYNRYKINGLVFDVPIEGVNIKINDFQFTKLSSRDFVNIKFNKYPLYDLLTVFMSIVLHFHVSHIPSDKKLNEIDHFLSQFINIFAINKIGSLNKINILQSNKIGIIDPKLQSLIKLKSEKEILSIMTQFFPISDSHKIKNIIQ